ncbi:MAG TPA: AAA family ATPase [Candidatus Acidoferrum sp.]
MFLDFYKLREQPFGVTPDPRYLYFSPGHREALASLFYGIETGRGFLSLIAEPGMGKTTLLFQLLQRWKGYVHSAFLFQTQCNSHELVRYLLDDLGLKSDGEDIVRMHSELNDFLYRETKAGRRVVVFIDEAQNLSDTVLETVRLLSDFEAPDKKLLQIILAGQPELEQRLARSGLAQLRQRIAIQSRLDALPSGEVVRYIDYRLQVAGYEGAGLFTAGALELIAERSRGIPRLINNICFNAMSLGCANQQSQIDSELVKEASKDLAMDVQVPELRTGKRGTLTRPTRALRPLLESSYRWIKDGLIRRRLFQASAILLVFCGMAIYVGARSGSGTPRQQIVRRSNSGTTVTPASRVLAATQTDAAGAQDPPAPAISQNNSARNSVRSFAYVVQRNDTLRDLCVSTIGRYDSTIVSEIRELNPDLKNPDHLYVGQEIRLPSSQ